MDEACFKEHTKAGTLSSLWAAWDTNLDGRIDSREFSQARKLMDLDNNGNTTLLEVSAYFAANNYLICRPLRADIISTHVDYLSNLQLQVTSGYVSLFYMLDTNKNLKDPQTLDSSDLPLIFDNETSHFTHTDEIVSKKNWETATKSTLRAMCTS